MYKTIDEANQAVAAKIVAGSPFLLDVVPAKTVISELNEGKVLLHAGPPIRYDQMIDPLRRRLVGFWTKFNDHRHTYWANHHGGICSYESPNLASSFDHAAFVCHSCTDLCIHDQREK